MSTLSTRLVVCCINSFNRKTLLPIGMLETLNGSGLPSRKHQRLRDLPHCFGGMFEVHRKGAGGETGLSVVGGD